MGTGELQNEKAVRTGHALLVQEVAKHFDGGVPNRAGLNTWGALCMAFTLPLLFGCHTPPPPATTGDIVFHIEETIYDTNGCHFYSGDYPHGIPCNVGHGYK